MSYNRLNRRSSGGVSFFKILAFLAIPTLLVGCPIALRSTQETITATVTEKERITTQEGGHYLIFTDGETFSIEDSFVYFRFSGSDLYGRLQKGKTYRFTVYGFRIPVMSSYRNIIDAEPVK